MTVPPTDIVDRGRARVVCVDREGCDHCGPHVQAFVYATMPDGKPLTYCGSCGTRYMDELTRQAKTVLDLRHQLHEGP